MAPNKADLVAERAASKLAQLQARGLIAAPAESASTTQPNSCQTTIPGAPVASNAAPSGTRQHVWQCVVVPAYCTLEEIATRSGVVALREVPLPLPPLPIVQPRRPASGTASTGTGADLDSCSLASFDSHIGVYSIDGSRAWLAAADSNCSTPYTGCTVETPSSSLTHCGFDACYPGEQSCPSYVAAGHGPAPPVPPGFEKLVPLAGAAAAALFEDASDDDLLPVTARPIAAAALSATGAGNQASRTSQQAAAVQFYYQAGSGYHRMGGAGNDSPAAVDAQQLGEQHGSAQTAIAQLQQLYRARQMQQQGLMRAASLPLPPALAPMPLMFGPTRGAAVTAAVRRGLGSAFERQPELFRQLYGFELQWWAGVRGRPVGEDDLLRVLAFKDYAVVFVRSDPYAAPALAPPTLSPSATRPTSAVAAQRQLMQRRRRRMALNAPMSALLGQRVCGNAIVIRLWVDFASNHPANAASSGASVSSGSSCWVPPEDRILLAPITVTSLRNELLNAETVAWHLQQSDAMMSEMRLGPERQAGWLLRLPRTPLDMRGDPDTVAALQLAAEAAGLPPMPPGKAAALLAAAAAAARKAAEEDDEEGGIVSEASGASTVPVPGVPQELAPLLRCVRCTSPWCHPGRRGAALLCPFGHMWRHLDPVAPLIAANQGAYEPSPSVAASMAPPVLNAARPAALHAPAAAAPLPGASAVGGNAFGAPAPTAGPAASGGASVQALLQPMKALVAEPCESLVAYLSDPDTWCGSLTDLVAAAVEGGMDGAALAAAMASSGAAAEHSQVASSAACTSDTAAQAEESGEGAKSQDDEREAMYAAATAAVRPEGWPFYLGFCAQGPQCTRCHSGHELRLATVVQRLKAAAPKKKPTAGPNNRARNVGKLAPGKQAAAIAAAVAAKAAAGKGIATRSGFAALEVEDGPARDSDSDLSDWEEQRAAGREQPEEATTGGGSEDEPAASSGATVATSTSYVRAVTAAVAAAEVAAATRTARLAAVTAAAEAAAAAEATAAAEVATAAEAAAAATAAALSAAPPALAPSEAVAAATTAPASTWSIVSAWYEAATAAASVAPSELQPAQPAAVDELPIAPEAASAPVAPKDATVAAPARSEAPAKGLNPAAAPWPAAVPRCDSQTTQAAASAEAAASRAESSSASRSLNPAAQPWTAVAEADGAQRSVGSSGSMEFTGSPCSSASEPVQKSLNPAALPWRAAVSPPQAATPAAAEPIAAPEPASAETIDCCEDDEPACVTGKETDLAPSSDTPASEQAPAEVEARHAPEVAVSAQPDVLEQPEVPSPAPQSASTPANHEPAATTAASTQPSAVVPPAQEPAHAPKPAPIPIPSAASAPAPAHAPSTATGIRSWAAIAAKPPPEPQDDEWYEDEQEQEESEPQPAAPQPISFCGQWAVMRMPGRALKKVTSSAAAPAPASTAEVVAEPSEAHTGTGAEEGKLQGLAAQDAVEACHVPPAPATPPAATGSSGVDAELSGAASRASAGGAAAEVSDSDAFEAVVAAAAAAGKFNWADEAEHEEQELAAAAEAEAEAAAAEEDEACRAEQEQRMLQAQASVEARWRRAESPKRWRKEEPQAEVVVVRAHQEARAQAPAQPPPPPPPQQRPTPAATTTAYSSSARSATYASMTTTTSSTAQRSAEIPCVSFAAALAAAAAAQRARDGLPAESDDEVEELEDDEEAVEEPDSDEERRQQEEEEQRRVQQQVAELQQRWKEQRRAQQEEEEKKQAEAARQRQVMLDSEAATADTCQATSTQASVPASQPAARKSLSDGFEPASTPDTSSTMTTAGTAATSSMVTAENAAPAQPKQSSETTAAEPVYEAPRYQTPPQFFPQQPVGYMAMPGGGGYVALMAPSALASVQMPQMPIAVPLGSGGGSASSSSGGAAAPGPAGMQAAAAPPTWTLPPQAGWPAGSQVTWVPVIQPPPQQQGMYGALPGLAPMPGTGAYGFVPPVYGATQPMPPTYQAPAYQPGYQPSYVQAQQPLQPSRQPLAQTQPYMPHQVPLQPQPKAQLPYFMQPRTDARAGRLKDKLAAAAAGGVAAPHMTPTSAAGGVEDEGEVEDLLSLLVPESR